MRILLLILVITLFSCSKDECYYCEDGIDPVHFCEDVFEDTSMFEQQKDGYEAIGYTCSLE